MKIAIGSDHAGFIMKEELIKYLRSLNFEIEDCGAYELDLDDNYLDYSPIVARKVMKGECEKGIVICGTGIGASISANKVDGIRAALCSEPLTAKLSREHNDANVVALGARMIGLEMAKEIVTVFLNTNASDKPRYTSKANKLGKLIV